MCCCFPETRFYPKCGVDHNISCTGNAVCFAQFTFQRPLIPTSRHYVLNVVLYFAILKCDFTSSKNYNPSEKLSPSKLQTSKPPNNQILRLKTPTTLSYDFIWLPTSRLHKNKLRVDLI